MTDVVGYTTGVYDLFHIGHLNVLQRASEQCDRLIVGVTTDELSLELKKKRPVIPYEERAAIVAALRGVSAVVPQHTMDKVAAWDELRFNKMFVGDDWRGSQRWNALEALFAERGVEIVYFPYTTHTSSTALRAALDALVATGQR